MRRSLVIVTLVVALVLVLPAAAWPRAAAYPCPASAVVYATQDLGDGSTAALLVQAADLGRSSSARSGTSSTRGRPRTVRLAFAAVGDTGLSAPAFRATGGALRAATLTATVPMWQFDVSGDEDRHAVGERDGEAQLGRYRPISTDRQRSTLIDEDTGLPFTIISRGRMRDATVTETALLPDEISWTLSGEGGNLAATHEVNISYRH